MPSDTAVIRLASKELEDENENESEGSNPQGVDNLASLLRELIEPGPTTRHTDTAIDLPDAYRLVFGIERAAASPPADGSAETFHGTW
ncbi:hypothetical protein [Streptomyces sp. NPDC048473]|uniref:hypothetical protein n=1 Tax=unclassified Streptomyces TaxID=2593676 RepID=UPI0037127DAC